MIKSELIERISSQNPHLFERIIEKDVNAILDEMVEALRRGDRVELRGFGAFSVRPPRSTHGAQPPYWCCRRGRKESYSRVQDGKRDARAA
jgi:integration host factor subunit beta